MILLIDMDGVIADFEQGFFNQWRNKHPDKISIPVEQRNTFFIIDQYPFEYRGYIQDIFYSAGFFRSLPMIPGSREALNEMIGAGIQVFICTSPFEQYKNCVLEKFEWIEMNFGSEWIKRIVLTYDKTIVKGDFLIDDMPKIKGIRNPTWEQILYDTPYNRTVRAVKRLTWKNWKTVFPFQ